MHILDIWYRIWICNINTLYICVYAYTYIFRSGNAGPQNMYMFNIGSFPLSPFPKWFFHFERFTFKLWPEGQKKVETALRFLYYHLPTTLPKMCPFLKWLESKGSSLPPPFCCGLPVMGTLVRRASVILVRPRETEDEDWWLSLLGSTSQSPLTTSVGLALGGDINTTMVLISILAEMVGAKAWEGGRRESG